MDNKKVWADINLLRSIPAMLAFCVCKEKQMIKKDIDLWVSNYRLGNMKYNDLRNLAWLLLFYPEYRNVFYYRLSKSHKLLPRLIKLFFLPMQTLYICTRDIGAGLFIQHGFSTIISAKSIGENCWINQQVTIGFSNLDDCPVIGNNVRITAGAKVIGDVHIGDNSIIGANAVVVKDVPPDCTVVGNPSFIVKKNGMKVKEYLA